MKMFHLLMMMVNDMQPFQIRIINKTQLDCNLYVVVVFPSFHTIATCTIIILDVLAIGNDSWNCLLHAPQNCNNHVCAFIYATSLIIS